MDSIKTASSGPLPAYQRSADGALSVNKIFYDKIGDAVKSQKLVNSFTIPIRSAQAWEVKKGQVCRIIAVDGPQVGDLNVWNLHDPRERLWAARTRQLQSSHVTKYDQLWSTLPFLRPLLTITGDSLGDYGIDEDGGRVHDLLGTRCDPYVHKMLTGEEFDYCCHSNLVRAVLPYKLTEFDVHDVLNVFQVTGLNKDGKYFMQNCPAKKGDFFEFFAEIDLLCALSACPSGDQSIPLWSTGEGSTDEALVKICRPLGIEVYDLDKELLEGWISPQRADYKKYHGLGFPKWGK